MLRFTLPCDHVASVERTSALFQTERIACTCGRDFVLMRVAVLEERSDESFDRIALVPAPATFATVKRTLASLALAA